MLRSDRRQHDPPHDRGDPRDGLARSRRSVGRRPEPADRVRPHLDGPVPAGPARTHHDLGAANSTAQLTVTTCLFGLAAGQLFAGPLSDRFGRRRPLLIGVVAYVVTSVLCAASPTVEALVAARFVQGLAGGVGIVIAQAAGRDLYSGGRLLRYYGRL